MSSNPKNPESIEVPKNAFHVIHMRHLKAIQKETTKFVLLIFGNHCAPCRRLKPKLFEKIREHNIPLGMIYHNQDPELNKYVGLGKIPYVVAFDGDHILGGIQNSDIDVTWPFVQEKLSL